MREALINLAGQLALSSGFDKILRLPARRRITIVNYHDPSPEVFESHLLFFRKRYSLIGMDAAMRAIASRDFANLPDFPLVITFDDGHVGNYRLLELFSRYQVPATIYVTAGLTGTNRHFWWLELRESGLPHEVTRLKTLSSSEFRRELKKLCAYELEREYPDRHALNWDELRELQQAGISVGAHSVNHLMLDRCSREELDNECRESKRILASKLGIDVKHFALPNGNGSPEIERVVMGAGYLSCRTIVPGTNGMTASLSALKNNGVGDFASLPKAVMQTIGIKAWLKH